MAFLPMSWCERIALFKDCYGVPASKYWHAKIDLVRDHWQGVASIVVTVISLYIAWGKIALAGCTLAGCAIYHYKFPIFAYLKAFDLKGVALAGMTLTIPTLPFPLSYMAAAAIAMAYLAREKEAKQARITLEASNQSQQQQIGELRGLKSRLLEMGETFQILIQQDVAYNAQLRAANEEARGTQQQTQEKTVALLRLIEEMKRRIGLITGLSEQLRLGQELDAQIAQQTQELAAAKAEAKTVLDQILPQLQTWLSSLQNDERASAAQLTQLQSMITNLSGGISCIQ